MRVTNKRRIKYYTIAYISTMVITMKKICLLLIILGLFLFGCTAPNSNDLSENSPLEDPSDPSNPPSEEIPEGPVDPPKKPDEAELIILESIRNSFGTAGTEAQYYLESCIESMTRDSSIVTSLPGIKYTIKSSENGKSAKGTFYVLDRIDNQFTWKADITSYEITGKHDQGEYKITGTATYSGIGTDNTKIKSTINSEMENYLPTFFINEGEEDDPAFLITEGNLTFYLNTLDNYNGSDKLLIGSLGGNCSFIGDDNKIHIYDQLVNYYDIGDPHGQTLNEGYEKVDDTYFWPWWLPY